MGDANPIRTLVDYSKPSHEGYRNTIELPVGNNVVPLRSDTIRLVQNGCSFHGLRSEDPNQPLNDFLKLMDSLDLDGENRERTHLTAKLRNDILMFQQHHGESLSEAWTRFKDLLQKVPHHGIDLWLQDLALYDNKSWNDPRDFTKPVKAKSLPQDVSSTSDRHLIKLENQVQRLMEAHIAPQEKQCRENTIELPVGNNVVPLRSDTIRLVQNGCSFHGLWSEDPNQHLKDFIKLVDSLDLDGSITTWEDLTTRFLAQFFPPGRTSKLPQRYPDVPTTRRRSLSKHRLVLLRTYKQKVLIMASDR
ncbi:hypothetical protein Tco_0901633 [Tanacetum coccineum]